jgi:FMN phosphatase YigB (HAD superfamily)
MRCYNGAPDNELQAIIDDNKAVDKELAALGMRTVWFPMEGMYMVFKDINAITDFHNTKRECLEAVKKAI